MRVLPLLAMPALLTGCSIPFDFTLTGNLDFVIGEINPNCTIEDESTIPENCTVSTSGETTSGECVVTARCGDLVLVDTAEVESEIDDATNNNDRITARIEAIELVAESLTLNGFNGQLPPGTTATATAFTNANATAFDLGIQDYEQLVSGTEVTIFDESRDAGSPFIDELNTALDDGNTVFLTGELIVTIPDVSRFGGTTADADGSLSWRAEIDGRGGVSLRRQ